MEGMTNEKIFHKRKRIIVKKRLFRKIGEPSSRPWKCKYCSADFTRYKLWNLHQQSHQPQSNHHDEHDDIMKMTMVPEDEKTIVDEDPIVDKKYSTPPCLDDQEEEDDDESNNNNSDVEGSFIEEEEDGDQEDIGDKSSKLVTQSEYNGRSVTVCNFCFKVFSKLGQAIDHVGKHTGEKRYSCSSCPMTFRFSSNLSRHMRVSCVKTEKMPRNVRHHRSAGASTSSSSSSHQKVQSSNEKSNKTLQCSICLTQFATFSLLKAHVLSRHRFPDDKLPQKEEKLISSKNKKSEEPEESSQMKTKKARLIVLPHSTVQSEYVTRKGDGQHHCNLCNRNFPTAGQAICHVRTHTGEQPFQCSACKRKFSMRANCIRHIRVHTGEKPYSCSICFVKFPSWDSLDQHRKSLHHRPNQKKKTSQVKSTPNWSSAGRSKTMVHHDESKWGRSTIGLGGGQQRVQSVKTRKSNSIVPTEVYKSSPYICCTVINDKVMYVCNFCNKIFDRPSLAVIHSRTHTGETEFQCDSCDKGFNRRYRLKAHQEKHHS